MIATLLLAVQAAPAAAPAPVSPAATGVSAADPARLAAAEKLIVLTKIESTLDTMFVQLAPGYANTVIGSMLSDPSSKAGMEQLLARDPGNKSRIVAILSQEFMAAIKRQYPAYLKRAAAVYAESFTLEDLNAINAFYSSGPGAKALTLLPQLQLKLGREGQDLGRAAGAEAAEKAFARIKAEMAPTDGSKTS